MEYRRSDSSGTEDDLPLSHSVPLTNRYIGNGKPGKVITYGASQSSQSAKSSSAQMIRKLEQEAYTAVVRAFGAQSELTWEKESLLSNLRKELHVTDEQHRECLGRVAGDDTLRQIREWSVSAVGQSMPSASCPAVDLIPSPAFSQSQKKQKTGMLQTVMPPPPLLKPPPVPSVSLPPAVGKKGAPPGPRKKNKMMPSTSGVPSLLPQKGSKPGRKPLSRLKKGKDILPEKQGDPWIGRRVKTRWPEDNNMYEAYVASYNEQDGKHTLVYDMGTENESLEQVKLSEVPDRDLIVVESPTNGPKYLTGDVPDKALVEPVPRAGHGKCGRPRNVAKDIGKPEKHFGKGRPRIITVPDVPTERPAPRQLFVPSLEGLKRQVADLEHEVDLSKIENSRRAAKDHEEAIRKALAEIGESSDEAGSDHRRHQPMRPITNKARGQKNGHPAKELHRDHYENGAPWSTSVAWE